MSHLARLTGDAPSALAWAGDAFALVERTGYRHLQGIAKIELARAHWALGRMVEAEADLQSACAILSQLSARFDLARAQLLLAGLLYAAGSPSRRSLQGTRQHRRRGVFFLIEQERALAFHLLAAH